MSSPLTTYKQNLEQVEKLIARMYADLEKYADKPEASEAYISIQNEILKTIVSFINSSEILVKEAQTEWIDLSTFNLVKYMFEATLIAVSENGDQELLYKNYSNAFKYLVYLQRGFSEDQILEQIDSYELDELRDKFYALKRA